MLVSCLCVSQPARWGSLQRAILDFRRQTYKCLELIVVVHDADFANMVQAYVETLDAANGKCSIKVFQRNSRTQIDGLLYAAAQAQGSYLAFWDDDNQNHPDRMQTQMETQLRFPGSLTVLTGGFYYFHDSAELYVVRYTNPASPIGERTLPTSLIGPRDVFPPLEGQNRAQPTTMLINSLARTGRKLVTVSAMPLHLVGVQGDNLRDYDTHRRLGTGQGACSAAWIHKNQAEIKSAITHYHWDVNTVDVSGSDAMAFSVGGIVCYADWLAPVAVKMPDESVTEILERLDGQSE